MKEKLISQINDLGIKKGDILLIHSSFKSLGGGVDPKTLIEAFFDVLGEEGTLVFPALSYIQCSRDNPYYDHNKTPTCIGFLTEFFRTSVEGTERSLHPTHSCCAKGAKAAELLANHGEDITPCGKNSPFTKLAEFGGKIMFLGCGTRCNTSVHAAEEISQPDYLYDTDPIIYHITDKDGEEYTKECRRHGFKNAVQRYERIENLLTPNEITRGKLLEADCTVMLASPVREKAHKKLMEDSHYFVDIL